MAAEFLGRRNGGDDTTMRVARDARSFAELEPAWTSLRDSMAEKNPFLSYAWTRACWETLCRKTEPFIVTLWKGDQLLGLAPLCIERKLGFRTLRFIAEGRSDYLGFLCSDADGLVEEALLKAVLADGSKWDLAIFRQLASPFTTLHEARPSRSMAFHRRMWTTSAFCQLSVGWDSLHERGPGWLREMRRRLRRFIRDGGTAERFTGKEAIERLHLAAAIETRSWKARKGAMRLQPGAGQDLLRRAFEAMGTEIELWLAFRGEQPLAFRINFATPERLLLYQGAYDEHYSKSRAGSILSYLAIEHSWHSGAREYDYLSGEEPYKAERTTSVRSIYHLCAHRRALRGWLAYVLLLAPRWNLRQVPALRFLYDGAKRLVGSTGAAT